MLTKQIEQLKKKYRSWRSARYIKKLIRQSGGVPSTLDEAFIALEKILKLKGQANFDRFKNSAEDEMGCYHFGLGLWMRNYWGLWKGGLLKDWFGALGIHHADDISGIILVSFWRKLNGKALDLEGQIKTYRDHWIRQGLNPDTMKEQELSCLNKKFPR